MHGRRSIILLMVALLLITLTLGGCGGNSQPAKTAEPAKKSEPSQSGPLLLNGAGATFPYPLYSKWFDEYTKVNSNVRINYQSIGSGGGINQITQKTVNFGASDGPMTDEQLSKAPGEILHIPTTSGAVAVAYNLPGIQSGLKLDAATLADIYLGKIKKWNDSRLTKLNPDLKLPATDIVVVHRSDGSGTTFIFTDYLSQVSAEWKEKVGKSTSVKWPTGLGGKGNEGVAGQILQTPGGIGYVELAYALQNKIAYAQLKNQAGKFIEPSLPATTVAAAGMADKMPADLRVSIVNSPAPDAYPIVGFTWILIYKNQDDPVKGKAVVDMLWWAIHDGQKYAEPLHYARLPEQVVKLNEAKIKSINYQGKSLLSQ
ncbi:MAG: phosphate ABC transporter substrate-binding protein PstS [Firmicutes bacterium]|nr:phosphate ABC transporter substrate-binding protein PstS [Bacillota bacterium]MCL5040467.1 phosphate ABC transporter substrate-binding protein PstS [Bacillota bacterium]